MASSGGVPGGGNPPDFNSIGLNSSLQLEVLRPQITFKAGFENDAHGFTGDGGRDTGYSDEGSYSYKIETNKANSPGESVQARQATRTVNMDGVDTVLIAHDVSRLNGDGGAGVQIGSKSVGLPTNTNETAIDVTNVSGDVTMVLEARARASLNNDSQVTAYFDNIRFKANTYQKDDVLQ